MTAAERRFRSRIRANSISRIRAGWSPTEYRRPLRTRRSISRWRMRSAASPMPPSAGRSAATSAGRSTPRLLAGRGCWSGRLPSSRRMPATAASQEICRSVISGRSRSRPGSRSQGGSCSRRCRTMSSPTRRPMPSSMGCVPTSTSRRMSTCWPSTRALPISSRCSFTSPIPGWWRRPCGNRAVWSHRARCSPKSPGSSVTRDHRARGRRHSGRGSMSMASRPSIPMACPGRRPIRCPTIRPSIRTTWERSSCRPCSRPS